MAFYAPNNAGFFNTSPLVSVAGNNTVTINTGGVSKTLVGATTGLQYTGVCLGGLEFSPSNLPGTFNTNYFLPTLATVQYWITTRGCNFARVGFLWERMQPALNGPLNSTYFGYLQTLTAQLNALGATVLWDLHNYGQYNSVQIGANGGPTNANFANVWGLLATAAGNNPLINFGLMNEPAQSSPSTWVASCNAAIAAIRATGNTQRIMVPGCQGDSALDFVYSSGSGAAFSSIVDSANNWCIEVHQYFDSTMSGTAATVLSATISAEVLSNVTNFARQYGYKLFLGEWGGGSGTQAVTCLDAAFSYMQLNADVWLGSAMWGAGGYWGSGYALVIDQLSGVDQPQALTISNYTSGGSRFGVSEVIPVWPLTLTNPTYSSTADPIYGYALTGGYGQTPNDYHNFGATAFTIDASVTVPSGYNSWSSGQMLLYADGNIGFLGVNGSGYVFGGDTAHPAVSTSTIADGKRHRLRASWDSTGSYLFLDGVLIASNATAATISLSNPSQGFRTYIACDSGNSRVWAAGPIDFCATYGAALSKTSYTLTNSQPTGREHSLLSVWNFENNGNGQVNTTLSSSVLSVAGRTDAVTLYVNDVTGAAPLASPALTGTPTAPTATLNDSSTKLATTGFVIGQAASLTPLINNTAAVGSSTTFARADHIHPKDVASLGVISPTLVVDVRRYNPSGHTFGTLAALSTLYGTLAAAQAVFPTAVSLTDQIDGEVIILALSSISGTVMLPAGNIYTSRTIAIDAATSQLRGVPYATVICGQLAGSNPVFSVNGGVGCGVPMINLQINGYNTGGQSVSNTQNGVAHTKFVSGSSALKIIGNGTYSSIEFGLVFDNLSFQNFDQPVTFDSQGSMWLITMRHCAYVNSNYGYSIMSGLGNAFENMRWENCISANNNYGFSFTLVNGSNASIGASLVIDGGSIDYNILPSYYQGCSSASGLANCDNHLLMCGNLHWENSVANATTAARANCPGGIIHMDGVTCFEATTPPTAMWSLTNASNGYVRVTANAISMLNGSQFPLFYTADTFLNVTGGNILSQAYAPMLAQTGSGNSYAYSLQTPVVVNGYDWSTANFQIQNHVILLFGGSGNNGNGGSGSPAQLTISPDSALNHLVGTYFELITQEGYNYWTLVAGSGVTLLYTQPGGSAAFGGAAGIVCRVTKILANTWTVTLSTALQPSSTAPLMDGTAAVGTAVVFARGDHVHPSDTTRAVVSGRILTSGASTTMLASQPVLVVRKSTPSATAVTLPGTPVLWQPYVVKDGGGNAATYNITVTPSSGSVDGAASVILATNYQSVEFINDGTTWNIT